MEKLKVNLQNCYGINSFDEEFDFSSGTDSNKSKAYAIYAPNGLMKSSFAKTFEAKSKGEEPKEERFNRPPVCHIKKDSQDIEKHDIYVLKAEIDISFDSPAITDILVDPENKARYDELIIDLDKSKTKLLTALQKLSKIKKNDIEKTILNDWNKTDFPSCINEIKATDFLEDLHNYEYAVLFDPKAIEVLKSKEFIDKATEFNERYQELFNQVGTIYKKGIFNPTKAQTSFSTLDKQGFFAGGHKVHFQGDLSSVTKDELDQKIDTINAKINEDDILKKLHNNLAKNAQTQALTDLLERLPPSEVEYLLEKVKPEKQLQFRKDLWLYYIKNCPEVENYISTYSGCKKEIEEIEKKAAQIAPRWTEAVTLFNNRFLDMPFTLSIANQTEAALGKEKAHLVFIFKEDENQVERERSDTIKTLSQGEKRALYLLNFIFEVEARKQTESTTLFILDDVADSFDYKNKHAIVQYLRDLSKVDYFYQIILTHNFDFFRSLANSFVQYSRCLMANKTADSISLSKAEGIRNYFIGKWKDKVSTDDCILCATIPFTRNLLEYTKGDQDADYLLLTSLLHWKNDTDQITVGQYYEVYNNLFGTDYDTSSSQKVKELLFLKADEICGINSHDGLNLENKVLLSIAIRLQSEIYLINEIRKLINDEDYWCQKEKQFGCLIKKFQTLNPSASSLIILEKVSITVSSNIHLNSFMYEPILDLTIEHLISLYQEVKGLIIDAENLT